MITNNTKQRARGFRLNGSAATGWLLLSVVTLCGCTKFSLKDGFTWFEKEPKPEVPDRMVAVWTHSIMNKAGQPSTRGFGGRVTFFNGDGESSILVDGQLTVYAFDEECRRSREPGTGEEVHLPPRNAGQSSERIEPGTLLQLLVALGRSERTTAADKPDQPF
jgi:hypothetical protein